MAPQYRYPGARPFTAEQQHIFFGRDADIQALLRLLQLEQIIVLFGDSGMGKSSLLNAGLLPHIDQKSELQPLLIRFGAHTKEEKLSPIEKTNLQLQGQSELLDRIHPPGADSLWYHLKGRQLQKEGGILLVFDQFEELFTYPPDAVLAFAQQLSEALFTVIPDSYRLELKQKTAANPAFLSEEELQKLHTPLLLKTMLVIRADRLKLLNELKPFLPHVMDHMHELKALPLEQVEEAIFSPAYEKGDFVSKQFDYENEAVDKMVHFLSKNNTAPIESFQLQILCSHLEKEVVVKQGRTLITSADLQQPEAILEDYYFDKLQEIPNETDRMAARQLLENGLLFEEEERRVSLFEGQILRDYGISPSLLRQLLDTHLIRSERSDRGGYTYELSHDTLIQPVLKAKRQRVAAEKKAAEARALEAQYQELREERRKRAQARTLAGIMTALAAVAVITSIYAFRQTQYALRQNEIVEMSNTEIEKQKDKVDSLLGVAIIQKDNLNSTLVLIQAMADTTKQARIRADSQRAIAERNLENLRLAEFKDLQRRAADIIVAEMCPDEIIIQMENIARAYEENADFRNTLSNLRLKKCKK